MSETKLDMKAGGKRFCENSPLVLRTQFNRKKKRGDDLGEDDSDTTEEEMEVSLCHASADAYS